MKRLLTVLPVALGLVLTSCTGLPNLTRTVTNPVTPVTIYQVKNTYAISLELAVAWREYCWARPYKELMADPVAKPACQGRRAVLRKIQVSRPKAAGAIQVADDFVRNNPTLSAATVIGAAWTAVSNFKAAVPSVAQ